MVYKALLNIKECPTSSPKIVKLWNTWNSPLILKELCYCIPNTSVIQFCNEHTDLIENNVLEDHGHIIMLGDFNIHMDKPEHPDTVIFNDFLNHLT